MTTVTAVDPENDNITYSIPSNTIGSDKFQINNTGDISVKGTLDRETTSSYQLTIEAKDTTLRQTLPSRTLFIVILDVNDEDPKFTFGESMLTILEVHCIRTYVQFYTQRDLCISHPLTPAFLSTVERFSTLQKYIVLAL